MRAEEKDNNDDVRCLIAQSKNKIIKSSSYYCFDNCFEVEELRNNALHFQIMQCFNANLSILFKLIETRPH